MQVPDDVLDQLLNITAADLDAVMELGECLERLPKESCIAPLAAGMWEQGQCHGRQIAMAGPTIDLREDQSRWTCYGEGRYGCEEIWYNQTYTYVDERGQTLTNVEPSQACIDGCFPHEWAPSSCGMAPRDWVCDYMTGYLLPPETPLAVPAGMEAMTVRQFYDTVMGGNYDPYRQPNVERLMGLSAEQCLEFCNSVNAECCSTEDGQFDETDEGREYRPEPFACYARTEGVTYPYQDPTRRTWDRITTTKVVEEPDPDSPEMKERATCHALCDNDMSCGGWNLDPYAQINCARFDLRTGLTPEEQCLARPEGLNEVVQTCEWNEDDQTCEPKRECGTQCKMWYVALLSFCLVPLCPW